ncbi:MAG: HAMP domain-containing histidine kinase [Eubacterium sp.]|nr:HAMP domain-containing histidine kinase [Eubacterium sp.]
MKIMTAGLVILSLLVIYLLVKVITMKSSIRNIRRELAKTKEENYNRQIRTTLNDRDVEKLVVEINENLDYQKNLKLESAGSRRQLEKSISDIAHDLRTPLTVVKGNLQMMRNENLSDKGREYLDISFKKVDTLKEMVDEFFEMSVLESDQNALELRKIDVPVFLSEFIIENEALIREKNLTPNISLPEKSIYIKADSKSLSRVFSNIFGNIYKYAKGGFDAGVEVADGSCVITIANEVSNPEEIDINRIFDRTYRADKARTAGGAGLGLYIAKLLVEKQKGSIEAKLEADKLKFEITFAIE